MLFVDSFRRANGSLVGSWLLVFMGGSSYILAQVPKGYSILSPNLYLLKKRENYHVSHQNTSLTMIRIINSLPKGVDPLVKMREQEEILLGITRCDLHSRATNIRKVNTRKTGILHCFFISHYTKLVRVVVVVVVVLDE